MADLLKREGRQSASAAHTERLVRKKLGRRVDELEAEVASLKKANETATGGDRLRAEMAEMREENWQLRRAVASARSEADAAHGALAALARQKDAAAPEAAERWLRDDVDAARARLADVLREAAEVEERTRRRKAALDAAEGGGGAM